MKKTWFCFINLTSHFLSSHHKISKRVQTCLVPLQPPYTVTSPEAGLKRSMHTEARAPGSCPFPSGTATYRSLKVSLQNPPGSRKDDDQSRTPFTSLHTLRKGTVLRGWHVETLIHASNPWRPQDCAHHVWEPCPFSRECCSPGPIYHPPHTVPTPVPSGIPWTVTH